MNHLSHAILSFPRTQEMVGQYIGDAIRGDYQGRFNSEITKGIYLHRWIDTQLDSFSYIKAMRAGIRDVVGRYSPVFIDVLLDHFLAKNWQEVQFGSLQEFQNFWYDSMKGYTEFMSPRLFSYYSSMPKYNWFVAYSNSQAVKEILCQMSNRLPASEGLKDGSYHLEAYVKAFEKDYFAFWKEFQNEFNCQ
jgi:acyl carrier protein phosphodiesterase